MEIVDSKKMFEELKKHVGENIICYYWHYGVPVTYEDKLEKVVFYRGIVCEDSFVPFIGNGCAISGIRLKNNNETIYYNPNIKNGYDIRNENEIDKVKAVSYGSEVAFKQKNRRVIREQKHKMEIDLANRREKLKKTVLTKRGLKYVHEDLRDEWVKHVIVNTKDSSSCAIIELSIEMMDALVKGANREDIEKIFVKKGLSGYPVFRAITTVAYFTNLLEVLVLPESTNPQRTLK